MTYVQYIARAISAYTKEVPDEKLILEWVIGSDNAIELQDWVCDNLRIEFEWCTSIGIIESAIRLVNESQQNIKLL